MKTILTTGVTGGFGCEAAATPAGRRRPPRRRRRGGVMAAEGRERVPARGLRGEVVAVVLTHRGRICMLRRSTAVGSDRGRWHCVTGFLPRDGVARAQALAEVFEETGLSHADLTSFVAGPVLSLSDTRGGRWLVHPYRCETTHPELTLNWENDAMRWVNLAQLDELPIVEWLPQVAVAVGIGERSVKWAG